MFSGHYFNHEDFLDEEKQQDNDTHVGITKKEKINTQYAQSKTEWQHKTNSPDSEIWLQCQHKKAKELMAQWQTVAELAKKFSWAVTGRVSKSDRSGQTAALR